MVDTFPKDWPAPGDIDLSIHDLPHKSSTLEWWYLNAHITTIDNREYGLFAAFFRLWEEQKKRYIHFLLSSLSDLAQKKYYYQSLVDPHTPETILNRLNQGRYSIDPLVAKALREILSTGKVPEPDEIFASQVVVAEDRLFLNFDGNLFFGEENGDYFLELYYRKQNIHCKLQLHPLKQAIRHGCDGIVRGIEGEAMFYYFLPRCQVSGEIEIAEKNMKITGTGWYDHEFGGKLPASSGSSEREVAWNWVSIQLEGFTEITAYRLVDAKTGEDLGYSRAIIIDEDSQRYEYEDFSLFAEQDWTSLRSFNRYPIVWCLRIPAAEVNLEIRAIFPQQEVITVISPSSMWEGKCKVKGTIENRQVFGIAYVERTGFNDVNTIEKFFAGVSRKVAQLVPIMLPLHPDRQQARNMIGDTAGRYLDDVDLAIFSSALIAPFREIIDRGGKAWRSYAGLLCYYLSGGEFDEAIVERLLVLPEILHVGSLLVDDVEDQSPSRRGGPSSHTVYGAPLAINSGCFCFFLWQRWIVDLPLDANTKLRIYEFYFELMRMAHLGQAIDLAGFEYMMPQIIESGDSSLLEKQILRSYSLKTGAQASAFARFGCLLGSGSDGQMEVLSTFFEDIGTAFQIVDDILDLRGFQGDRKERGEDLREGKITMPIAKTMSILDNVDRERLWQKIQQCRRQPEQIDEVYQIVESCGALRNCEEQAKNISEAAWDKLSPMFPESRSKVMLRSFIWYLLRREY